MRWRLQRNGGRLLAIVIVVLGAQMSVPSAEAQNHVRAATDAPPIWIEYAQYVLFRVRDWLTADDRVQRLRDAKDLPPEVVASIWIAADGKVSRIAAHSLEAKTADAIRHAVEGRVLDVPPPDMPQPLRLRFTFKREHES